MKKQDLIKRLQENNVEVVQEKPTQGKMTRKLRMQGVNADHIDQDSNWESEFFDLIQPSHDQILYNFSIRKDAENTDVYRIQKAYDHFVTKSDAIAFMPSPTPIRDFSLAKEIYFKNLTEEEFWQVLNILFD